ncbi:MAG: NYN domain-containing protein [Anaerovoracaceae bacterium]|nr:NYN domain-containing protein [Anaerovoracaceae bacterium]
MEEKRIALLIDSDNVSADYIEVILDKVNEEGVTTYRRIYGDWTRTETKKWKNVLLDNSITPIQQFSNTKGKNSTDISLIIDAMDILYSGKVEGFCIVSSDSDFTRLASRLREEGMFVICMGEDKTPPALIKACNKFVNLDVAKAEDERNRRKEEAEHGGRDKKDQQSNVISMRTIERRVRGIVIANNNKDRGTTLGEVGSKLQNRWADFDVANYGCDSLSQLIESIDSLRIVKLGKTATVELKK